LNYDIERGKDSKTRVAKAYEFCITSKNGHWAPGVCKDIISNALATDDITQKVPINNLLLYYLEQSRAIEKKQPVATTAPPVGTSKPTGDGDAATAAAASVADKKKAQLDLLGSLNPLAAIASALQSKKPVEFFFSNLGVDDAPGLVWSDYEKGVRADIQGKNKTVIMQKMNDARKDGGSDKIKGFRRACVGINGSNELVQKVLDKCFTPENSQTNEFFPSYLPINDDHLEMFVKQAIDPTSVWLVYPFDMSQTRSKTEAEYWNDLKAILQEVDENMIRSAGQSGAKYFDEYLAKRCLPLASKPGLELMNDVACNTWVKLNTLESSQRDNVIDTFCGINNDAHAGSRECSCYWTDTGNDAPWKDKYGRKNYDMEKDPDPKLDHVKRMQAPICYLQSCKNSGMHTQVIKKAMDSCPKCVSMNTVMGSNNKVNQSNTCALNTENIENIAGPNAAALLAQPTPKNTPTPQPTPPSKASPSASAAPPQGTSASTGVANASGLGDTYLMYGSASACCACCGCAVVLIVVLVVMNQR
jgi:hypothetical protein